MKRTVLLVHRIRWHRNTSSCSVLRLMINTTSLCSAWNLQMFVGMNLLGKSLQTSKKKTIRNQCVIYFEDLRDNATIGGNAPRNMDKLNDVFCLISGGSLRNTIHSHSELLHLNTSYRCPQPRLVMPEIWSMLHLLRQTTKRLQPLVLHVLAL